ncbi:MAG: hypothetical protein V3S11_07350, partial [Elusimicrobiota bacterium]
MRSRIAVLLSLFLFSGCAVQRGRIARWFHFVSYVPDGPAPKTECRKVEDFSYCVDIPPKKVKASPDSLLYVLHHAGGGPRSWSGSPAPRVLYARFRKAKIPPPVIVSVSYGPFWTLMDAPGSKQKALFESFISTTMPRIEADVGAPKKRLLWGVSQGAFNGAQLIFKRPKLFDGAVLSCPAIYTIPLYSGEEAIRKYTLRTKADPYSVVWGIELLRPLVGGPEAWEKENPLALARTAKGLPPVMIQANVKDEFGFFEGGKLLAEILKNRGEPVEFRRNSGSHCAVDPRQASDFLIDLLKN